MYYLIFNVVALLFFFRGLGSSYSDTCHTQVFWSHIDLFFGEKDTTIPSHYHYHYHTHINYKAPYFNCATLYLYMLASSGRSPGQVWIIFPITLASP